MPSNGRKRKVVVDEDLIKESTSQTKQNISTPQIRKINKGQEKDKLSSTNCDKEQKISSELCSNYEEPILVLKEKEATKYPENSERSKNNIHRDAAAEGAKQNMIEQMRMENTEQENVAKSNDKHKEQLSTINQSIPSTKTVSETRKLKRGLKSYCCMHCDKSFAEKGNLTAHIRTHTGDKPHQCVTCLKSFSRKRSLRLHLRTHTGEKPYQCKYCCKTFSQKGNLARHVRIHTGETPYQCKHCDKKFSDQGHLKSHFRTHTGEKPYQCPQCHKRFSRKEHLTVHIRTHSGEKPYQCKHCSKRFSRKVTLTKHIRAHTEKNLTNASAVQNLY